MKEKLQARDRSSRILAALSAAFGGIFTCNANKTETTVGYGTLYGDLAGAFAATADLWKYQIYDLGRKLNAWYGRAVIPKGIFTVMPSAELSENQDVTQGKGDPLIYEYHDYLFRSFIEPWQRQTPEDILKAYAKGNLEDLIGCSIIVSNISRPPKISLKTLRNGGTSSPDSPSPSASRRRRSLPSAAVRTAMTSGNPSSVPTTPTPTFPSRIKTSGRIKIIHKKKL